MSRRWPPEMKFAVVAVVAISVLESTALARGVDGMMFGAAMAAIGAIVGWVFKGIRG